MIKGYPYFRKPPYISYSVLSMKSIFQVTAPSAKLLRQRFPRNSRALDAESSDHIDHQVSQKNPGGPFPPNHPWKNGPFPPNHPLIKLDQSLDLRTSSALDGDSRDVGMVPPGDPEHPMDKPSPPDMDPSCSTRRSDVIFHGVGPFKDHQKHVFSIWGEVRPFVCHIISN